MITTITGRHYLLARKGQKPYHAAEPCYLMTAEEADNCRRDIRAQYGTDLEVVDAGVTPTCVSDYPGNGSHCEREHGHQGLCEYVEPRSGTVQWAADREAE